MWSISRKSNKIFLTAVLLLSACFLSFCLSNTAFAGSKANESKKVIKTDVPIIQEVDKAPTPMDTISKTTITDPSGAVDTDAPKDEQKNDVSQEPIFVNNTTDACSSSTPTATPDFMPSTQVASSPLGGSTLFSSQKTLSDKGESGKGRQEQDAPPGYAFSRNFKYEEIENITKPIHGTVVEILPETTTQIFLSNTDINRIVCVNSDVKDVIVSQEKGIKVQAAGKNAFVKYMVAQNSTDQSKVFASVPTEMFVICTDNTTYSLIAVPKPVRAQTILLKSGKDKVAENLSMFDSVPLENKITKLVKNSFTDTIPQSFSVTDVNERINIFMDIDVFFKRTVSIPGEGLILKEFVLSLKHPKPDLEIPVKEKDFLVPELAAKPLAISLEPKPLKGNAMIRLFVVERSLEDSKEKEM